MSEQKEKPRWTKDPPNEPGWYWVKSTLSDELVAREFVWDGEQALRWTIPITPPDAPLQSMGPKAKDDA